MSKIYFFVLINSILNNMNKIYFFLLAVFLTTNLLAQSPKTFPLYTDNQGVLRRTSNNAEVSYCGTNYTLPFAHPFRATNYLNVNKFQAIDDDVYQFARLGFNAFRLHLWDVELSDSVGNLIENEHLKILDYLIFKLEQRGIDIILTAQTNFGNGYPEKNFPTGGFSYLYDKNEIHSNPKAIQAQRNYIQQLAKHVNEYSGKSYLSDTCIVAFEINNEPVHSVSIGVTKNYIDTMVNALRTIGFEKSIFYNVSHNHDFVSAYYDTKIDGTTYQWYPIGLVSGHEQTQNFLPYLDSYDIDFKDVKNFDKKAKIIYEFDPADVLLTYLYPAAIRSFRSAGFQWITQFAYDPTFLACYNTDYQTHYLNLFTTPGKAIGMKIACELSKKIPLNTKFEKYPNDTVFFGCTISHHRDLALYNTDEKYFYTNNVDVQPVNPKKLKEICGVKSSPIVKTNSTGAYFIDKLQDGVWRLEVFPNQYIVSDPFEQPSFKKKVCLIDKNALVNFQISLEDLGELFDVEVIKGEVFMNAVDGLTVLPGVYLLKNRNLKPFDNSVGPATLYNNIQVSENVSLENNIDGNYIIHQPSAIHEMGEDLKVQAFVFSPNSPVDSVLVYPKEISFWRDDNKSIKMDNQYSSENSGRLWEVTIPKDWYRKGEFGYYIIAYSKGKCVTYPSGNEINPLDWDAHEIDYYSTQVVDKNDEIVLINSAYYDEGLEFKFYPRWNSSVAEKSLNMPFKYNSLNFKTLINKGEKANILISKDIRPIIRPRTKVLSSAKTLKVRFLPLPFNQEFEFMFVDDNGVTFSEKVLVLKGQEVASVDLSKLKQRSTIFSKDVYPIFLKKEFFFDEKMDFKLKNAAIFEVWVEQNEKKIDFGLVGALIE